MMRVAMSPRLLSPHAGPLRRVALTERADLLLTVAADQAPRLWQFPGGAMFARLSGHERRVLDARFAASESAVVSVSWDRTARLWDAATGAARAILEGRRAWSCLGTAATGALVAAGTEEGEVQLWDVSTGARRATWSISEDEIEHLELSPSGALLACSDGGGVVRLVDTASGDSRDVRGLFPEGSGDVLALSFSPDGASLLVARENGAEVLDVTAGLRARAGMRVASGGVPLRHAAFSRSADLVVTAGRDGRIRLFDLADGGLLYVFEGHTAAVSFVQLSEDGARLLSGGEDGTARLWDARSGDVLGVERVHEDHLVSAVFAPGGDHVVTAGKDGLVAVWETADLVASGARAGRPLAEVRPAAPERELLHGEGVWGVAFAPGGERLVTSSPSSLRLWGLPAAEVLFEVPTPVLVYDCAVSPRGDRILGKGNDDRAWLWDGASGEVVARLTTPRGDKIARPVFGAGGDVIVSSDGTGASVWGAGNGEWISYLASGAIDPLRMEVSPFGEHVYVQSPNGKRGWLVLARSGAVVTEVLPGAGGALRRGRFSPCGRRLAVSDGTGRIQVIDTDTGGVLLRNDTGLSDVEAAISPDGGRLAVAGAGGAPRVVDVAAGNVALVTGDAGDLASRPVFSPDGTRIFFGARGQGDGLLWDDAALAPVAVLRGHRGTPRALDGLFCARSERLFTWCHAGGAEDPNVRAWDARTGAFVAALVGHAKDVLLSLSADGQKLVTWSAEPEARLWSAVTGELLALLGGHPAPLRRALLAPGGAHILTVPQGRGAARLWRSP